MRDSESEKDGGRTKKGVEKERGREYMWVRENREVGIKVIKELYNFAIVP